MTLAAATSYSNAHNAPSLASRPRGRPRKTLDERDDGNRRQQLLQGAAKLFRRKGYGATTTRDIAAATGMHSGSPFYHFKSKNALLYAVMEQGMRSALERQNIALRHAQTGISASAPDIAAKASDAICTTDFELTAEPLAQMRLLVRAHFDVLLGVGNDFIPVMLYEARSLKPHQRSALAQLQTDYEAAWAEWTESGEADLWEITAAAPGSCSTSSRTATGWTPRERLSMRSCARLPAPGSGTTSSSVAAGGC